MAILLLDKSLKVDYLTTEQAIQLAMALNHAVVASQDTSPDF